MLFFFYFILFFNRKKCVGEVEGYYRCLKDQTFTAIVNCRESLKILDDCAAQFTTEKQFQDATLTYLIERRHKIPQSSIIDHSKQ
jgi:hypothetical protein